MISFEPRKVPSPPHRYFCMPLMESGRDDMYYNEKAILSRVLICQNEVLFAEDYESLKKKKRCRGSALECR